MDNHTESEILWRNKKSGIKERPQAGFGHSSGIVRYFGFAKLCLG